MTGCSEYDFNQVSNEDSSPEPASMQIELDLPFRNSPPPNTSFVNSSTPQETSCFNTHSASESSQKSIFNPRRVAAAAIPSPYSLVAHSNAAYYRAARPTVAGSPNATSTDQNTPGTDAEEPRKEGANKRPSSDAKMGYLRDQREGHTSKKRKGNEAADYLPLPWFVRDPLIYWARLRLYHPGKEPDEEPQQEYLDTERDETFNWLTKQPEQVKKEFVWFLESILESDYVTPNQLEWLQKYTQAWKQVGNLALP